MDYTIHYRNQIASGCRQVSLRGVFFVVIVDMARLLRLHYGAGIEPCCLPASASMVRTRPLATRATLSYSGRPALEHAEAGPQRSPAHLFVRMVCNSARVRMVTGTDLRLPRTRLRAGQHAFSDGYDESRVQGLRCTSLPGQGSKALTW